MSDHHPNAAGATAPAIDGWFSAGDPDAGTGSHLIGSTCPVCGTYAFPPRPGPCPSPHCDADELTEVALSSTGTLWSFAENHYAPPPPYRAAEPFEPYALAAVELAAEGLVVLGQAAAGVRAADLHVGMPMVLDTGELYTDDDGTVRTVWTWRPADTAGGQ